MISMINYPLEPSQISLISMFTIGIPSFVLALEPNKDRIQGHFMTNVLLKALPAGLTDFFGCQQSGIVLSGIWCERRGHFDILYDTCCYCWIYDLISDRKTDDGRTPGTDGWNGRRLAVLHDICQPLICNQGYLRAVYDADCGIYGCSGVHSAVSVEICGVDAGKSFSVKKENTSGNSMKEDRYSVRIKTG